MGDLSPAYEAERYVILRAFGANLRLARRAEDYSQRELGRVARVHDTEVGLLERGLRGPGLLTILILADALNVTPVTLLHGLPVPQERKPSSNRRGRAASWDS
jgi:transcriptional regulator with XRE-family HTH domain